MRVAVDDADLFNRSLCSLHDVASARRTHGDVLAVYLALKYHQPRLPTVGGDLGLSSGALEDLLDGFYTKKHGDLGSHSGQVCRVFGNSFTPPRSYDQNNWRDFFRYALGVGCLAPDSAFRGTGFLAAPRSACRYLARTAKGDPACGLHPQRTRDVAAR